MDRYRSTPPMYTGYDRIIGMGYLIRPGFNPVFLEKFLRILVQLFVDKLIYLW